MADERDPSEIQGDLDKAKETQAADQSQVADLTDELARSTRERADEAQQAADEAKEGQ